MHRSIVALSAIVLLFASSASADLLITSRSSLLASNIDFGYVGSVTTTTDSFTYSTIDNNLLVRQGSASDGGPLGDISWDASYQYSLEQQFDPGSPQSFGGSGGIGLFTFVAGDGVSYITSTNRLVVDFENTAAGAFDFTLNPTPQSSLGIEHKTSSGNWEVIYSHPGSYGVFVTTLLLDAGEYRLTAETVANTDNGFSNGGSWSFSIVAVPEPSTLLLAAVGAVAARVAFRRRAM